MAIRRISASLLAAIAIASPPSASAEDIEYRVKAEYLFNFLNFVEWQPPGNGSPWVIGVLGYDPFGPVLDETVRGQRVNGRRIEVRRYAHAGEVVGCNILFVSRATFERAGTPMRPGMMTVGEAPGFLRSGGVVNFYIEGNRLRFEIQPSVARAVGLRVRSQLLRLGGTR